MNKPNTQRDYAARINRVLDYIYDNLDGDLSAQRLADEANFSLYHWHRIFHAMTGSTVADSVRRLRLHRAAYELGASEHTIEEIAVRAGYGSSEAFSRAFRSTYAVAPTSYRNARRARPEIPLIETMENVMENNVDIRSMSPIQLCTMSHRGAYMNIGQAFERLCMEAGRLGLMGPDAKLVAIYFDDPGAVVEDELRSAVGITADPTKLPADHNFDVMSLEGGRHAVFRHVGPYADLEKSYRWLYGSWLPTSGEEAADRPAFEMYVNDHATTPPPELLTDIYLPLKTSA